MAKVYGQENPQFTVSYSGLVNGESGAVLLGTLAFDCAADTLSPVDNYAVTPGGLTSDNYEISFAEGVLTVTPKPVTVTAENKTKTAGDADPALTAVVSGLVGSDTLSIRWAATRAKRRGTYAIRVAPGSNPNYSVKTVDAVLTITAAPADPTGSPDASGNAHNAHSAHSAGNARSAGYARSVRNDRRYAACGGRYGHGAGQPDAACGQ